MRRPRLVNVLMMIAAIVCLAVPEVARADRPQQSPTPPMGFNDWNAYGCNVDAALIESEARSIHDSGMQADGYRYVNIDDCWLAPQRSATGQLQADPVKFPQGIAAVARYVHHLGLKFGIYEDAGVQTCAGYPGSFGHFAQDARTFAAWGVDYLKFDQCNIPFGDYPGLTHEQVDAQLYRQMSNALTATGRDIVFSACTGVDDTSQPWLWAGGVSNLWRTTTDVRDNFASTLVNFAGNVGLWPYAHAGAFNDPDALEIGNGGQTPAEYRSQFSLWAEMAAPLIAGTNLTTLTPTDRAIYENRRVIAVDQDPLARQGRPVLDHDGVWVLTKPLSGGDHAVVLFNSTSTAQTVSTTAGAIGARRAPAYRLQDLWSGQVTRTAGRIAAFVPAEGTVMYRVSRLPVAATGARPATVLSLAATPATVAPGATVSARLGLADEDRAELAAGSVTVSAPAGWTPATRTLHLGRGRRFTRTLSFTAPVTAPSALSAPALRAVARVTSTGRAHARATASAPVTLQGPLAAPFTEANTTGAPATVGQLGSAFSVSASGTGISAASTSSRGARPASDAYAAVADPGAATPESTATVTLDHQTGSPLSPLGSAGLIERPSLAGGATPEGVVLQVNTAGTVTLQWAARGGTVVDTAETAPAAVSLPVTLRLQRRGATYIAAYSTDAGAQWTTVATATLPGAGATGAGDVGVFHSSGTAGWVTQADFSGFAVGS